MKPEVSKSNSGGLMSAKQMSKLQKAASAKMASKMGTANAVKPAKPPKQKLSFNQAKLTSSKGPSWKPEKPGGSGKTFDYPAGNYGKLVSAAAKNRLKTRGRPTPKVPFKINKGKKIRTGPTGSFSGAGVKWNTP